MWFQFRGCFRFQYFFKLPSGQLVLISSFFSPTQNHSTKKPDEKLPKYYFICCEVLKLYCYFEVHDRVDDTACTIAHSRWAFSYYDCIPYSLYSGPMSPHTLVTSLDKKFTLFIDYISLYWNVSLVVTRHDAFNKTRS